MPRLDHDHTGARIKEQRKLARLTQRQLADRLPYSYSLLNQVECGAKPANLDFEVISIGEPAVADEGAGDAREGEEVVGFALVASVETAAACEPGHGAFDGPAVAAQSL